MLLKASFAKNLALNFKTTHNSSSKSNKNLFRRNEHQTKTNKGNLFQTFPMHYNL